MSRLLATAAFALLAGCGYVGPPLPPALNMPQPIQDLRAVEIGDQIVVRFTPPSQTTEDLPVTGLRGITLYIGPGETEFSRDRWAATAKKIQIPVTRNEFEIPASDWVGQSLVLAVRTTGPTGRESDWSKYSYLTVSAPLVPPTAITFTPTPDAVALKWTGNAPRYRVLRSILSDATPKLEPIGETEMPEYLDSSTAYGTRYQYVILGLAGENQQSLPSQPAVITPADVFAPAVPTGLSAVASTRAVDLSWTRNTEADLDGYNLFRAVDAGPFTAFAEGIVLPAFTDTQVEAGKRYRYAVSAYDKTGNQSERSAEAVAQVE